MYISTEKERMQGQDLCEMITEALGMRQHIKCNFVPWVLTCMACDQALQFCQEAKDQRAGAVKRTAYKIKSNAAYFLKTNGGLTQEDRDGASALLGLYDRKTTTDQWLAEINAGDSARQEGAHDISRHATLAFLLLLRAAEIDRNTDRKLRRLTGKNLQRRRETSLVWLEEALRELRPLGYLPEPNEHTVGWVKVLENKASLLADELIDKITGASDASDASND